MVRQLHSCTVFLRYHPDLFQIPRDPLLETLTAMSDGSHCAENNLGC